MRAVERSVPLIALLLLTVGLAGCLGSSGKEAGDPADANVTENLTPDNVGNYTVNSTVQVDEDTRFDPDSDLHAHDYWEGRESVTIVDGRTVQVDWAAWGQRCSATASCHQVTGWVVDVPVAGSGPPNFVYPGTGRIDVTLSWSSQGLEDAFDGFSPKVCVSNRGYVPNCRASDLTTNATHVYASSGQTWTIEDDDVVNRWTADPPHAEKSNWRFLVLPCRDRGGSGQCSPQVAPNVGTSEFTVTVTIHKAPGDLPLDPPHFAFFDDDERELTLLDAYPVADGRLKATHQQWLAERSQGTERVLWYVGGAQIQAARAMERSEQPVVPGQTQRLTATLEWTSGTDASLQLKYRSAADAWQSDWRTVPTTSDCGSGCIEATIPVKPGEADSPYALKTQWEFGIFHTGETPVPMTDFQVTLSIHALREETA